eukprot:3189655-Rhodomonas_salina.1
MNLEMSVVPQLSLFEGMEGLIIEIPKLPSGRIPAATSVVLRYAVTSNHRRVPRIGILPQNFGFELYALRPMALRKCYGSQYVVACTAMQAVARQSRRYEGHRTHVPRRLPPADGLKNDANHGGRIPVPPVGLGDAAHPVGLQFVRAGQVDQVEGREPAFTPG